MKKTLIYLNSLFFILFSCSEKKSSELFKATDFTAENLFTNNIEGPAFDADGNLYVVNFGEDGTIGKVDSEGNASLFLTLPEGSTANSIKFGKDGTMYLADYTGHNVLAVDMATKAVSTFAHNDAFNQPNDLCIDRQGRLFASDPNWGDKTGQIWRIEPDGSTVLLDSAMGTTNGIALSPDEKTLYVNESVQLKIWAFDVDANGEITNKREFASFDDFGFDGMKCDKEGNLYVARYGKGVIAVLNPAGELVREVALMGKKCSNLVFGGEDGKTVFVTLQDRKGMEKFLNDIPGKGY
ncbi:MULTISPECIES: SMP-30/gluconolactonase/LRE family protein [unclassified Imperialibacter]|uniref:SMP-30/gluconolactonase/LRE family protein n=1 Tax=unclassified Imperialibacter TaxID=2629706 RepID=UPI00125814BA|nr:MULTISPECIES: SMP-30/gluconolactonase/LRE family protein [unclassified Imperialibacter]CAD5258229.1 SMP-30/gluconolactonase/LRE family protein [Imperialibacter sp. 89]CAD5273304.1 SMP-30/gluconolactonase/LRE family protein [Imperialibacter sp. 75]VVT32711.1 Sugar lactone lactonase YvrE [Imperialibacter sp. EC-SDR9]